MSKIVALTFIALVAGVLAEPPVGYLPPARNSNAAPSAVYGAPSAASRSTGKTFHSQRSGSKSFSYNAHHESQSSGGVPQLYGAPSLGAAGRSVSFGASSGASFGGSSGASFSSSGAVQQQYGAPSSGSSFGSGVSQQYGAPTGAASFGSSSGSSFGASGSAISSSARTSGFSAGSHTSRFGSSSGSSFGAAASRNGVSRQYGAPSAGSASAGFGSSSFGGAASSNGVSQQYGAPSAGSGFGASSFGAAGSSFGSSSRAFGAGSAGSGASYRAPAPVYGVPNSAAFEGEDGQSVSIFSSSIICVYKMNLKLINNRYFFTKQLQEPANYEYTYEVEAADVSGVMFGHKESRENESAKGSYHVLLPDGRTQIVEYHADEEGFHPKIRYEGTATMDGAGARANSGLQGPY
ncbi:hypothetical protein RUM44_007010 [Polyplax serrata]|uniref:Uncharacterized protein n=1 Tax=Polyplax serrata TaxID=468196 RepID=A0ABR1AZJ0_POLSC